MHILALLSKKRVVQAGNGPRRAPVERTVGGHLGRWSIVTPVTTGEPGDVAPHNRGKLTQQVTIVEGTPSKKDE